jgi:peptide/nickel transport system permease protein
MRDVGRLARPGAPAWDAWTLSAGCVLMALYLLAAGAPFFAPYSAESMDRAHFYHPPQPLYWRDAAGTFRLRPFVYTTRLADSSEWRYAEDRGHPVPLEFWVRGDRYALLPGVTFDRHLYGAHAARVYLLGADAFGRDVWSRLLFGARVSLGVGLAGIAISFALGLALGGLAGYLGGWTDAAIMRLCELLLSLPGLYLVIALRTAFPPTMPPGRAYLMIVMILAVLGWAALARVIRGLVRAQRAQDYVLAAEALGAGRARVLVRHILPNTLSFVIVAATVAIPARCSCHSWALASRNPPHRGATCWARRAASACWCLSRGCWPPRPGRSSPRSWRSTCSAMDCGTRWIHTAGREESRCERDAARGRGPPHALLHRRGRGAGGGRDLVRRSRTRDAGGGG